VDFAASAAYEPTMALQMWLGTQVPPFSSVLNPRQGGGSKGYNLQLHFMLPFAPCFSRLVAGAQVYLTDHRWLYQNPWFHPLPTRAENTLLDAAQIAV
jgi:hypothetical protein